LQLGYYGWRTGKFIEIKFRDGSLARLSPGLNAGSVGVQNLFAKLYKQEEWRQALYGADNFLALYQRMFGDPWSWARAVEPLFPAGITQAALELPFVPGERWSLTGGPHESWKTGSPRGALDLAPVTGEKACTVSRVWVTASAPGLVTRSERNIVAIDLDGDGYEQSGWVVLYFHVADLERVLPGTRVQTDDPLGHPSCEGGRSTGTHVHIARKYNGEWIAADGPLPFVLSGWQAYADEKNYLGELRRGDQVAMASPVGPLTSIVTR
jgi:murein DD-endopeptidase MepM/ murein hydrolase activator NlpD